MTLSRYVFAGAACAAMNNILVIGLAGFGIHYFFSTALAFVPVLCVGYGVHTNFTFHSSASWPSFIRYTLAMLMNYPIWLIGLYVLCDLFGVSISLAAPTTTALVFSWNFISTRWALLAPLRSIKGGFPGSLPLEG
ncbi:MAG: GtrA family protein [Methylocella sp.]